MFRLSHGYSAVHGILLAGLLAHAGQAAPGVNYRYFHGSWTSVPDFNSLGPVATGVTGNFDISVRQRDDQFGFQFTGFINIAAGGTYTFYTSSDDGSFLHINGSTVVDNDGIHAVQERSGSVSLAAGLHAIEVTFFEQDGGEALTVSWQGPGISKQAIPSSVLFTDDSGGGVPASGLMRQWWSGISGRYVADLTSHSDYPDNPSGTGYIANFEGPASFGDNYGTRIRGYVTPPTTGNYTFWIAGDDYCELWLSSDQNPANITRIAHVPGWTNSREWGKYSEQASAPRSLVGGQRYYVEVLHKENTGGDNIAVGWQGPGITGDSERPIPGSRLIPFGAEPDPQPPSISTHPADATVNEGQTANFSVTAGGSLPLSYQWQLDGADIPGATGSSYQTPVLSLADNGNQYRVVVGNSEGTVTSNTATLTVNALPPVITSQPQPVTVTEGDPASFSVTVTSSTPVTYQWQLNGSDIAGATAATYAIAATSTSMDGGQYRVVVANAAGSLTSSSATLTVNPLPPEILTHPADQAVLEGETATFNVSVARGSIQWRKNGVDIPSANSTSYTTPPTVLSDDGSQFDVVASNSAGTVTSNPATLTVSAAPVPPAIVTQPASQTVLTGQTATFSVTATGTAPLSYQWIRDGVDIPGADAASHTTPVTTLEDDGSAFSVRVSNSEGSATSAQAILTVQLAGAVPNARKIAISGELFDDAGNPVGSPDPVQIDATIRLFTGASAGAEVYAESFLGANGQAVTVDNGLFVARLGEGTTGGDLQTVLQGNDNLWVEITIEGSPPDVLLPRTPLSASAYSIR